MIEIEDYPYTDMQLKQRLDGFLRMPMTMMDVQTAYRFILNSIDLTTLEGADNNAAIYDLCQKAVSFRNEKKHIPSVAAVCVYSPFVAQAKALLGQTDVKVASVAGAFPAGQSPIEIKLAEVKYALQQGADEIDLVISRGKFLEGNLQEVYNEIRAIREACSTAKLKVILETGELKTPQNIYKASQLAIVAGADFIKTSTGKISVGATLDAFLVMMDAVKRHHQKTGRKVGIKAAGGISDSETALQYIHLLCLILGKDWLSNTYFRIGASRLATKVFDEIQ